MNGQNIKIIEIIKKFSKKLPKFLDGRIDYSASDVAPVITIFLKANDEFLLLKRSKNVHAYKGKWNTITGYLDEIRSIKGKVLEEIREETGISQDLIINIKIKKHYNFNDKEIGKIWIITPVLAELKEKPGIDLDWEHSEYRWIKKEELSKFDTVANLDETLKRALK